MLLVDRTRWRNGGYTAETYARLYINETVDTSRAEKWYQKQYQQCE